MKKKVLVVIQWKEELEDTKGVIRIHISKTVRQYNDQAKKYKSTNNEVTRTPLNRFMWYLYVFYLYMTGINGDQWSFLSWKHMFLSLISKKGQIA